MNPAILYEDNHLLVVNKPAGMPTQGARQGQPSVVAWARQYLKRKYRKPGNVYVGVVSRLDSPVSGVVVLARTSKAARRLNRQFQSRSVVKTYWAVVEGRIDPARGEWIDWIRHDARARRMQVVHGAGPGASQAHLRYRRVRSIASRSLVEVELLTGRKHQIRVQMAFRGWPIVGDRKYGSRTDFGPGIALHARRLVLAHPTRGAMMEFEAELPPSWTSLGLGRSGFGGERQGRE